MAVLLGSPALRPVQAEPAQGMYFAKKQYVPKPLPKFAETKGKLPGPIYDENPLYVQMYWKTWELGFRNFYEPKPGSGFVSQFIDAAFNQNIFLWDTCFLTMFCNYGHPLVPGIGSLDNFYAKQYADGEICREIDRTTGRDYVEWVNREQKDLFSRWSHFSVTYVGRDVPAAAAAPDARRPEPSDLRLGRTGKRSRDRRPLPLEAGLRTAGPLLPCAAKVRPPRKRPLHDRLGQHGQLAAQSRTWTRAARPWIPRRRWSCSATNWPRSPICWGRRTRPRLSARKRRDWQRIINEKMWDPKRKFYFDLTADGKQAPAKTVAAFWTLLAGVASPEQADALAAELRNPQSFGRKHRVPSTPADQAGFDPAGGYWRGSVWPSTNTMVIRGLERYGKDDLAREIALRTPADGRRGLPHDRHRLGELRPGCSQPGKTGQGRFRRLDGHRPDRLLPRIRHRAEGRRPEQPIDLGVNLYETLRLRAVPLQRPHGHAGGPAVKRSFGAGRSDGRVGRPIPTAGRARWQEMGVWRQDRDESFHARLTKATKRAERSTLLGFSVVLLGIIALPIA